MGDVDVTTNGECAIGSRLVSFRFYGDSAFVMVIVVRHADYHVVRCVISRFNGRVAAARIIVGVIVISALCADTHFFKLNGHSVYAEYAYGMCVIRRDAVDECVPVAAGDCGYVVSWHE